MRNFKLPSKSQINSVFSSFSKSEWIVFFALFAALVVSVVALLQNINQSFMVSVPRAGGEITEGIIGTPRFVNPILANSPADEALVSLIYSGLLRKSPDGTFIPDLASKYEMSENGLSYTFSLKDDLYFHNGEPVTADDVLFTVGKVKDSILESPRKASWDGINVEKIDAKTIKFILKQPAGFFLDNATLGIMPARLWDDSPLELNPGNTSPVGSGPYLVSRANKQSSGIIDRYELTAFKKFALGEPYIKNIDLRFYQNEDDLVDALLDNSVEEINSITPRKAEGLKEKNYQIESAALPRVFGLFFNQNVNQLFTDKAVRQAIDQAIDKDKIVREVLLGYGTAIDGPIPPNLIEYQKSTQKNTARADLLQKVQNDLAKAGWKKNEAGFLEKTTTEKNKKSTAKLEFSISTGNVPELTQTAELIRQDLAQLGIKVEIKTFETGNLNQTVIRSRQYDALLFGEIINHPSDLFAFWHSGQRNDPGLNVASYTNAKADKILEEASVTAGEEERIKKYRQFAEEIKKDIPAVFLYSPHLIYVAPKNLQSFKMEKIISPADRYLNGYLWYRETEKVWRIFNKKYQP